MEQTPEVECPKCKGITFDNTNSIVFRKSTPKAAGGERFIYQVVLVRCASCGIYLYTWKDKLVPISEA